MPKKTTRPGLRLLSSTPRRTNLPRARLDWVQKVIKLEHIDPSPYQRRRYFDQDKLKELAASIQREGLIEPIVVRPVRKCYELIAGERRLRAIRDYTELETIQAQIVDVGDLQARRISAAENMQREDLSAIEAIEAIVEIVDAELIEDKEYSAMGKTSMDRVKTLLGQLDSVRVSKARGSEVIHESKLVFYKFVEQVEQIFNNLPKPVEWLTFYLHDLPLLMDISKEVQKLSIQNRLNRSQTRALETLKAASIEEFQRVTAHAQRPHNSETGHVSRDSSQTDIRDLSAREIKDIAEKAAKKESLTELNRLRVSPSFRLEMVIFMMSRLGIAIERIAARLKTNRKTAKKYSENPRLIRSIKKSLNKGHACYKVAEEHGCPEPLVWSIALEGKSDVARFKSLGWGLRTWDVWNWNDCDKRFSDDWPGRIPAQMIAHILYYFSEQGDLVLDPMGGGGVTPDVCLAFNRRCWTMDMIDRPDTRPEIEPCYWDAKGNFEKGGKTSGFFNSKHKPDLIIIDPPYFDKKAEDYAEKSISMLPKQEYLEFFDGFFALMKQHTKKTTKLALINADWRDFQNKPVVDEDPEHSILIDDYLRILNKTGWRHTHIIQAPLSSERFNAGVVSAMQKKRILGVTSRYVIVSKQSR